MVFNLGFKGLNFFWLFSYAPFSIAILMLFEDEYFLRIKYAKPRIKRPVLWLKRLIAGLAPYSQSSNAGCLVLWRGHLWLLTFSPLINWPRKRLMESLLTKLLASPLLWAKKSSGVIWDTSTWHRWKPVKVVISPRPLFVNLYSKTKELQAISRQKQAVGLLTGHTTLTAHMFNPLNAELNPICHLLALLGVHHFLHVSRIRVKSLTLKLLMSYVYGAPIFDVSRSHTTTQHSR